MMPSLRAVLPPYSDGPHRARRHCRTRACDPRGSSLPAARSCCRQRRLLGQAPGQSPSLQAERDDEHMNYSCEYNEGATKCAETGQELKIHQLTWSIASFSSGVTAMVSAASAIWSSIFLVQEVENYQKMRAKEHGQHKEEVQTFHSLHLPPEVHWSSAWILLGFPGSAEWPGDFVCPILEAVAAHKWIVSGLQVRVGFLKEEWEWKRTCKIWGLVCTKLIKFWNCLLLRKTSRFPAPALAEAFGRACNFEKDH